MKPETTFYNNGVDLGFEYALYYAKRGYKITRKQFRDTCFVLVKTPDENSQNTLPYLQMWKKTGKKFDINAQVDNDIEEDEYNVFPVDLSCESIFAEDWYIIQ